MRRRTERERGGFYEVGWKERRRESMGRTPFKIMDRLSELVCAVRTTAWFECVAGLQPKRKARETTTLLAKPYSSMSFRLIIYDVAYPFWLPVSTIPVKADCQDRNFIGIRRYMNTRSWVDNEFIYRVSISAFFSSFARTFRNFGQISESFS